MPAHQRLRPYNLQGVQHPGSQAIEPNKQQAVDAVEGHSLRRFAPQDIELVPKHKDFGFQRSARPEQPDQGAPEHLQTSLIVELSTDSRASVSCFGFAVGRGLQYFRDATKISDHYYTDSAWPSRLGCLCRSPGVISAAIVDTMDEAVKMLPRMIALDRHAVRRRKSGKALDLRGDR